MKVCINGPGHMTKMAAMPYMVKTFKSLLLHTRNPMILKLGMKHLELKLYKVCINDDHGLTLAYFTARSNWVTYTFKWGKLLKVIQWGKTCSKGLN